MLSAAAVSAPAGTGVVDPAAFTAFTLPPADSSSIFSPAAFSLFISPTAFLSGYKLPFTISASVPISGFSLPSGFLELSPEFFAFCPSPEKSKLRISFTAFLKLLSFIVILHYLSI